MSNPNPKNQIDKDKRKDLPPRGKGKKTLMLEAVRATCGSESEFLQKVVQTAIGDDKAKPNMQLMTLVLQRIEPPMKSTLPLVNFEFNENSKPHEQAAQVMKAVSDGDIPADVGGMFVNCITSMLKIEEVTSIKEDIDEIKKALEEQGDG
jgi:hypothetical protein